MSESFGRAIDAKDPFTKHHSDEVAVIAHTLALALGLSAQVADVVHIAGHLHDIGKIGVPDAVLQKPGPLTDEQWRQVKTHPELGAMILSPVGAMQQMGVPEMVLRHHERFDGSGYPGGLAGQAIPLGARIIAVADSLSAMMQQRPYRRALGFAAACERIQAGGATQFDPMVVEAFVNQGSCIRSLLFYANPK